MIFEEFSFIFKGFLDWNFINDIFLSSILNSNETKPQWNFFIQKHLLRACAFIHDINLNNKVSYFGDDANRSGTIFIEFTSHFQAFAGWEICISWYNT